MGFIGNWWPGDFSEHEIGWALLASAEGKGFACEAAREVQRHSFHTLGWPTAVSYIHRENTRSILLAKRLGSVRDTNAAGPQGCDLVCRHMPPGMSP
jgi:RimJ/RimL family protein N-acetyltransferase